MIGLGAWIIPAGTGALVLAAVWSASAARGSLTTTTRHPSPVFLAVFAIAATVIVAAVVEARRLVRVASILRTVVGASGGAVAWIAISNALDPQSERPWPSPEWPLLCLSVLLLAPALSLAVTAFHEAGHAAAGKLVGLRVDTIVVGPFVLRRMNGRLRWRPPRGAWVVGGFVRGSRDGRVPCWWRNVVFAAGGPIADAALLTAAVWLDRRIQATAATGSPWHLSAALVTAAVGAMAALHLLSFISGSTDVRIIRQALQTRYGPFDVPHPTQAAVPDGPIAGLDETAAVWSLRRGFAFRDANAVCAYRDRIAALATSKQREMDSDDALLEASYATARLGEPERAAELLSVAIDRGIVSQARRERARGAIHLASGDLGRAHESAITGLASMALDGGDLQFDREMLLELREASTGADTAAAWLAWEKF